MKKCNVNTTLDDGSKAVCKSDKEINNFINDMVVDTWQIFQKMNYEDMNPKPLYKLMEVVDRNFLHNDTTQGLAVTIRKHYYTLND